MTATRPGQEAFATIREIVHILPADPHTDWSRIDITALRERLIDRNKVTLRAHAEARRIPGGLRIAVTGHGRTRVTIGRMVAMHARVINGLHGWSVSTTPLPDGLTLTVTAQDPRQIAMIRGSASWASWCRARITQCTTWPSRAGECPTCLLRQRPPQARLRTTRQAFRMTTPVPQVEDRRLHV